MSASPLTFASFRDRHRGATFLVCGCGVSLHEMPQPPPCLTIGVNDVGRLFTPNYLVVVNGREQFRSDRFDYVRSSKAEYVFSQLELGLLQRDRAVSFKLGSFAGTRFDDPNVLHFTRNSPYVAVCLAVHFGAKRIGLIGVDFTSDHFFARTGVHPLASQLRHIDAEYAALFHALARQGIQLCNLGRASRLTALPRVAWDVFLSSKAPGWIVPTDEGTRPLDHVPSDSQTYHADCLPTMNKTISGPEGRDLMRAPMSVAVQRHPPGVVGSFLDGLAQTARALGYQVTREVPKRGGSAQQISIVWNGRDHSSKGPTLFCEHGWLPRTSYQLSWRGINADFHLAPFTWDGQPPSAQTVVDVNRRLAALRQEEGQPFAYMRTDLPATEGLPRQFLLVPFQMSWDTNIQRHVPRAFREMQTLVDAVSVSNPPWPIVFKQHPADTSRGHQQLRLHLRRRQDQILPHQRGNIHQILKSGSCIGIVALNSNVVHDGLIWNVPSVVLGRNIWPSHPPSPFLLQLPHDWQELIRSMEDPQTTACRIAYLAWIFQQQWRLEDTADASRVARLLRSLPAPSTTLPRRPAIPEAPRSAGLVALRPSVLRPRVTPRPRSSQSRPLINVVAVNRGWLFEDLKAAFRSDAPPHLRVSTSELPLRDADAWIFIRTAEASTSPNPNRTVVQVHDLFGPDLYLPGQSRAYVNECAAVVLTHPEQKDELAQAGVDLERKRVLCRPIGARRAFQLRTALSPRFTVGWVGRPARHLGKETKRPEWLLDAMRLLPEARGRFDLVWLGAGLDSFHKQARAEGLHSRYFPRPMQSIASYPRHYQQLDVLVITSSSEAGPLPLFEALASGVPVISTPVGWAPQLIRPGESGFIATSPAEIAHALESVASKRQEWFARRAAIREAVGRHRQEDWITENLQLAAGLALAAPAVTTSNSLRTPERLAHAIEEQNVSLVR